MGRSRGPGAGVRDGIHRPWYRWLLVVNTVVVVGALVVFSVEVTHRWRWSLLVWGVAVGVAAAAGLAVLGA